MISSFIASAVLFSSASAYSVCSPATYPYTGRTMAPIKLEQTQQRPTGPGVNPNFQIQVDGYIQITGPCTFSLVNFTYSGVGINDTAVWYGGFAEDASAAVSLTDAVPVPITANRTTINYTFTTVVGKQVSYLDFNQFRLFTLGNSMLIARASIPNSPIKAPTRPAPTLTNSPSPSGTVSAIKSPVASGNPGQPQISLASRSKVDAWVLIAFLASFIVMY